MNATRQTSRKMSTKNVNAELRKSIIKEPAGRGEADINTIFSYLHGIESLASVRETTLRALCATVRYGWHDANDILYSKGDLSTCWYILVAGSVFIDGSMYLPRSCFGKRIAGSGRRLNECLILESSELLVIDYPDVSLAQHHQHHPALQHQPASSQHSSTITASSSRTDLTVKKLSPTSLTTSCESAKYDNYSNNSKNDKCHSNSNIAGPQRTLRIEIVNFADTSSSSCGAVTTTTTSEHMDGSPQAIKEGVLRECVTPSNERPDHELNQEGNFEDRLSFTGSEKCETGSITGIHVTFQNQRHSHRTSTPNASEQDGGIHPLPGGQAFPPTSLPSALTRSDAYGSGGSKKRGSRASDTSSAYSGSDAMLDVMIASMDDPLEEGGDVDLSGLVESIVDSDDEDLESDIGSLAGLRDSVRECLEKDPSERTEDDVEVLLDLMGHLPAFANMTLSVRRALCACMVFAYVEKSGTTVMTDGEELDAWSVILNGRVEVTRPDGDVELLHMGDSFGITPTTEKLFHKGVMKTLVDDCQFFCIAQADYYRILHQGEVNMRRHSNDDGEVVLVTEHRMLDAFSERHGQVVIRGSPERLLEYLVEDHSVVDPTYVEDFLLMSRTFIKSPLEVTTRLLDWFHDPGPRDKVTRAVLLWVNNHFNDFETNADLCKFLEDFEDELEKKKMSGQLRLLNIAAAAKARPRTVILRRSTRDEDLFFTIQGGWDRGYGIFVSDVERGSKADEAGLKRCDQLLVVNGQSFEHVSFQRAVDVLRGSTHLSITVKSNFLAFKQMLQSPECSPIRGHHRPKLVDLTGGLKPPIHRTPSINSNRLSMSTFADDAASLISSSSQLPVGLVSPIKEKKVGSKRNKIHKALQKMNILPKSGNIRPSSHLNNSDENLYQRGIISPSLSGTRLTPLPSPRASRTSPSGVAANTQLSASNPDLSSIGYSSYESESSISEFPEHVVRVYRSDQACRYLPIHKETSAKEVVMLSLQEFGITEPSPNYSLCEVSVGEGGLIKHRRLPDQLNDLAQRIPLNARYYLKSNLSIEQLVSDDVASDMIKEAHISFLQLNSMELAFQLTLADFDIFSEIETTEYVDNLFERDSAYGEPALEKFEELVNREMFWVCSEVCSEHNTIKRMKVVKHFIKIAKHCKDCKNFNSMFAILSGLGHGSVSRLRNTWEKLPSKYSKLFSDLQEVMDPSRNMAKYRNLLNSELVHPPMIPFFPVVKKDLTFLHLGNDSEMDGLINFEKLRMIAKEIRQITNMCSMKYDLRSMYDAVLIGNSPAADAAWTHGFYGASSSASSHFAHSSSSNLAGMATIRKRDNNKRRSQLPNPKKVYEEAQMSRKVRTYLSNLKVVEDEDRLHEMSSRLEAPMFRSRADASPIPTTTNAPVRSGSSLSSHSSMSSTSGTSHITKFGAQSPDNIRKLMSLSESSKPLKHQLPPSASMMNPGSSEGPGSRNHPHPHHPHHPRATSGYSPATSPLLPYNSPRVGGGGMGSNPAPQPASPANGRQHPARSSGGKLAHKIPLISAESSSVTSLTSLSSTGGLSLRKSHTTGSMSSGSISPGGSSIGGAAANAAANAVAAAATNSNAQAAHFQDNTSAGSGSSHDSGHVSLQSSRLASNANQTGFDSRRSSTSTGSSPHLPRRGFLPSANPLPPPPPPPSNVAAHHLLPPPPTSMTPAGSTSSPASSSTASQPQPQFQRRIAPDYSVAAQMAAQISHAKHVRQMNNAAAAARRTSFQSQLSSSPSQRSPVSFAPHLEFYAGEEEGGEEKEEEEEEEEKTAADDIFEHDSTPEQNDQISAV